MTSEAVLCPGFPSRGQLYAPLCNASTSTLPAICLFLPFLSTPDIIITTTTVYAASVTQPPKICIPTFICASWPFSSDILHSSKTKIPISTSPLLSKSVDTLSTPFKTLKIKVGLPVRLSIVYIADLAAPQMMSAVHHHAICSPLDN